MCLLWETNIHPYFLIKSLLYLWGWILRTTFPSIPHQQDSDLDSEWEAFNEIQKQKIESRSHYCTCKSLDNHMNFRNSRHELLPGSSQTTPKDDIFYGDEQHRSPMAILGVSILSYFLNVSFGFP